MKVHHILFPVDFSGRCQQLNAEVEWLAKHFDAEVTLLHVFEIPASWYSGGEASVLSQQCFAQYAEMRRELLMKYPIDLPEQQVKRVLLEGDAAWNIKTCAKENNVDLVVMGTHGYGTFRRILLGSVAMKTLHDVHCPIWTHSFEASFIGRVQNILCSLELTEEAVPLLRFTKQVAEEFGAEVRIVHCVPEGEARPQAYFNATFHAYLKSSARMQIDKLQKKAGTNFPLILTDQYVARDLADAAAAGKVDLILAGRGRSQGALGTWRTHLSQILSEAPCPVLSYSMNTEEALHGAPVPSGSEHVFA
ncbi:MAG: universal stress protein [Acidobacteriaceae bacterium]|nr:universal stress protein [Acidobacteriaceae bacterium]